MNEVMNWLRLSHHCIHRAFWKGCNNPSRSHTNSAGLQSWSAFFLDVNSPIWIYTLQELAVLQCITWMAAAIFQQIWCKPIGLGWWLNRLWIQYQIWRREWQSSREHDKEMLVKISKYVALDKQAHTLSQFLWDKEPFPIWIFLSQNALGCYHFIPLIPRSTGLQAFDLRLHDHKQHWVTVFRKDTVKGEGKREGKIPGRGKTRQSQVRVFLLVHLANNEIFSILRYPKRK